MSTNKAHAIPLLENQKKYIRKRVSNFITGLHGSIHNHNRALNLSSIIDIPGRKLALRISHDADGKYGEHNVATLKGEFEFYWTYGKRLIFAIKNQNNKTLAELPLHRRSSLSVPQAFEILKPFLPAMEDMPEVKPRERKARIKTLDHQPAARAKNPHMTRIKRAKGKSERRLKTYEPQHVRFIGGRLHDLESSFRKRLRGVFNDVAIDYTIDMEGPEQGKARMNIRLRPHPKHHVPGTPKEIWINGDLSLYWYEGNVKKTRLEFRPTQGLPSRNASFQGINLSRKSADVVSEIYNLIVSSRLVTNTSQKSKQGDHTPENGNKEQTDANALRKRTRFHRAHAPRRAGNSGAFVARVRSGAYPV